MVIHDIVTETPAHIRQLAVVRKLEASQQAILDAASLAAAARRLALNDEEFEALVRQVFTLPEADLSTSPVPVTSGKPNCTALDFTLPAFTSAVQ